MDLKLFCSKRPTHAMKLAVPWSFGEFTYASDGVIIIRVPRLPDAPENVNAPQAWRGELPGMFTREPVEWVDVPTVDYKGGPCSVCNGTAEAFMCPECEGEGEVYLATKFNDYDEQDCKSCTTTGVLSKARWAAFVKLHHFKGDPIMVDCSVCNSTGMELTTASKLVNGVRISERYLWIICNLPGAQLGTFGAEDAVRFQFDGGDGLVMPMRPEVEA